MLVSVIIPTYNSEEYILSAVKSVLGQTYQDFELIIVDDGSTDNTKKLVNSVNDSRIKYVYQENSGVAEARNTGIKKSTGEYIAFLDADDVWLPEKLQVFINRMNADNQMSMVYSAFDYLYKGTDKRKTVSFQKYSNHDLIRKLLIEPFKAIPYPSTVLVRKAHLDKAGFFNPELPTGEDWDLWLRLISNGKCCYIDKVLAERQYLETGITGSLSLSRVKDAHLKILHNFFAKNEDFSSLWSKAHFAVYYDLACRYFARNNNKPTKDVYTNLLKSFMFNPLIFFTKPKIKFTLKLLISSIK